MAIAEADRKRYLDMIKRFRLIDDTFFEVCFDENIECMQIVLRIILKDDGIIVKQVRTQRTKGNLHGHGVRFDVWAVDGQGRVFDCEVQRSKNDDLLRRARFNQGLLDRVHLDKGARYKDLPESFVIFIDGGRFFRLRFAYL